MTGDDDGGKRGNSESDESGEAAGTGELRGGYGWFVRPRPPTQSAGGRGKR